MANDIIHDDVGKAGDTIKCELLDVDERGLTVHAEIQETTVVEVLKRRGFLVYAPGTYISVTAATTKHEPEEPNDVEPFI